jgi:hypothetical protein
MNAQLQSSLSQFVGVDLSRGAVALTPFCFWDTWGKAISRVVVVMMLLGPTAALQGTESAAADQRPLQQPLNPAEEVTPSEDEVVIPRDDEGSAPDDPEGNLPPEGADSPPEDTSPAFLRPQNACPEDLRPLVDRLLQDLPTYAELVASRSLGLRTERFSPFGTVILASEADYEPIELVENPYGDNDAADVQQVFFTTLERQYWEGRPFSLQHYHWLFLARADNGWYLSQMYSRVGGYPTEPLDAPTPPQETSDGIIGQAVTLWLRDCRAGAVFPPDEVTGQ